MPVDDILGDVAMDDKLYEQKSSLLKIKKE